ncbi:MAG: ribonuclease PH [Pirellulaceae bacterium]|nr:ribonuclease PH [Pirellulaceae bacterium]
MTTKPLIRPVQVTRNFTRTSPGSVLYQSGQTVVLCTASIQADVPAWLAGSGKGWVTAEYNMLPHSTPQRKRRDRDGKVDGRTTEIQRLIGRSLRAIVDLQKLGERMVTVDCDVLQADGGTRTASITGGFLALCDALYPEFSEAASSPILDSVAAISAGLLGADVVLDLDYQQDVGADVDMNIVMTGSGKFVEIQGTGEEATFGDNDLARLIQIARQGIEQLTAIQREALGPQWPIV